MIVLKFGGTSVGGADPIRRAGKIIQNCAARNPVVISSAVGGVTNRLFKVARMALEKEEWEDDHGNICDVHRTILKELDLDKELVDPLLDELYNLLCGVVLVGELSVRSEDYLVSFGERMAVRILAAHLTREGTPATAVDAFDAGLITDSRFGSARPLPDTDERIRAAIAQVDGLPIVTGYIGKDEEGNITTLGRGGSDFSASIFGAALDAEEIQIWTDVDGVMTADPRIVAQARFMDKLSFAEASELAFYGAKVIHPATMIPAVRKNIPIRVLNSYRPEFQGTTIVADLESDERQLKSIASKDEVSVVTIVAPPMLMQYGFIERIADVFARHEVVIDCITTSEVSVAMTTSPTARLSPAVEELRRFSEVRVDRGRCQVSLVGEELRDDVGKYTAVVSEVAAKLGIALELISFGATRNNLTFVIHKDRLRDVILALHERLFERAAAG